MQELWRPRGNLGIQAVFAEGVGTGSQVNLVEVVIANLFFHFSRLKKESVDSESAESILNCILRINGNEGVRKAGTQ